LLNSYSTSV